MNFENQLRKFEFYISKSDVSIRLMLCRLSNTRFRKPRPGLSTLEILVSLGIIALLMSLLLPAVMQARGRARQTQCINRLRQIGVAMQQDTSGGPLAGLRDHIEQSNAESDTPIALFRCPADTGSPLVAREGSNQQLGRSNFAAVLGDGKNGIYWIYKPAQPGWFQLPMLHGTPSQGVTDGLSNTLELGEQDSEPNDPNAPWYYLPGAYCDRPPNFRNPDGTKPVDIFRSLHPGGVNFLLADGSTRFIADSIDLSVYHALSTPAGGEVVGEY